MHRPVMRSRSLFLLGALSVIGCAAAPAPPPLDDQGGSAPRIRLFMPAQGVAKSSGYLQPAFRLTDDAYVLIAVVDRDRRVDVLYPESPTPPGVAAKRGATQLERFFGGFGGRSGTSTARDEERLSRFGLGGVLLAIASDRPLQLQRLADANGDWDLPKVEQLVFDHNVASAAYYVAEAIALDGQDYTTDYLIYDGSRPPVGVRTAAR